MGYDGCNTTAFGVYIGYDGCDTTAFGVYLGYDGCDMTTFSQQVCNFRVEGHVQAHAHDPLDVSERL